MILKAIHLKEKYNFETPKCSNAILAAASLQQDKNALALSQYTTCNANFVPLFLILQNLQMFKMC